MTQLLKDAIISMMAIVFKEQESMVNGKVQVKQFMLTKLYMNVYLLMVNQKEMADEFCLMELYMKVNLLIIK